MTSAPKLKVEHKIQKLEFAKNNMSTDWNIVNLINTCETSDTIFYLFLFWLVNTLSCFQLLSSEIPS